MTSGELIPAAVFKRKAVVYVRHFSYSPLRYRNVIAVLKNPFYAGVYVYGKSEKRTSIIERRARLSYGHGKPIGSWEVMLKDHHEGYIDWAEYERNQRQLALNNYGRIGGVGLGAREGQMSEQILTRPCVPSAIWTDS